MSALRTRLEEECNTLRNFVTLLETEQRALVGGDVEQLLGLSDEKSQLASALVNLASKRREVLPDPSSTLMESWLKERKSGALPIWNEIQKLAQEAQRLNNTNGELIQVRLRHNQQALVALRNASNNAALYGPDGQHNLSGSGRTLGSV
ncbi:MAG: flagellar protein FlgN [Nitrosomonadales bacterium]|nr:flagellar protein FlgN [Nitrosomonadales bacterium]